MNPGGNGRTILVIDDDPDIQFVLQVILEDAHLRVLPAFTAEAGLLIAAERTVVDRGADDYLTKPFGRWDLITRVTSQLAGYHDGPATTVGRLQLLPEKSQVLLDGQPIALSRTEASALARLMAADGGVVSPTELLRSPWGYRRTGDNRVVTSMIARLRTKLGDDPTDPHIVLDEPGRGYRISTRTTSPTTAEPADVSELTWLTGQAPDVLRRSG